MLNRVGLAVTGLALCLLGGGALLRGAGVFGPGAAARPVVGGDLAEFARGRLWFWPSLAAGGFLLAVAGLCWLVSRLRPGRVRRVRAGAVDLVVGAVAPVGRAVAVQVRARPRVRRAWAVARGRRPWRDPRPSARGGACLGEVLALVGAARCAGVRCHTISPGEAGARAPSMRHSDRGAGRRGDPALLDAACRREG